MASGFSHREELWFLPPSVARFMSSVTVPAGSAPGLLGGKCLRRGSVTGDLGWSGVEREHRTCMNQNMKKQTPPAPHLEMEMGDADSARETHGTVCYSPQTVALTSCPASISSGLVSSQKPGEISGKSDTNSLASGSEKEVL